MRPILRLLALPLVLTVLWQATAAGQDAPTDTPPAAETDAARFGIQRQQGGQQPQGESSRHRQRIIQRRSSEKIRTGTHDSDIHAEPPPNVFESPEAKSADHIPKPLPSDEVRAVRPQPPPPAAEKARRVPGKTERAWGLYNRGRYESAAGLFAEVVSSNPRRALNARLGLAYCRLKQRRRPAAIDQLDYLVRRKYRLQETLPLLLDLLVQEGDYAAARRYLHLLPESAVARWRRRLQEGQLAAEYHSLAKGPAVAANGEWTEFLNRHSSALNRCIRPDIFFEAATAAMNRGDKSAAVAVYDGLLACSLPADLRSAVLGRLADLLPPAAVVDLLGREKSWFQRNAPRYLPEIRRLEIAALKRRIEDAGQGTAEQRAAAEALLDLDPSDREARAVLAWSDLEAERYRQSESHFKKLWQADPANRDYALGLGYSRLNLGRLDDALAPFAGGLVADDARTLELKSLVYKARARRAYALKDWPAAAADLEAALAADPADTEATSLLAWTRLRQNRREEAVALMEAAYAQQPDAVTGRALLDLYESGPADSRSWRHAADLARSPDAPGRRRSAAYFFSHRAPVTASQIEGIGEACYAGADSPAADAFLYHRNKSGDDGTSKLAETAMPLTVTYPVRTGTLWSLSATPRYLSSGDAPDVPVAGRYYRFLNGSPPSGDLEDAVWVWQPEVGFVKEGPVRLSSRLGASPIGGAVDPTPTLSLRLSSEGGYLDVHRCSVKESILSYSGLEDPYSSKKWGRVLRNGIAGGITRPVFEDYWFSLAGGFDYYTGENLWSNYSFRFDAAAGRTFDHNGDELTLGAFFTLQHYRRNSDFYTYGHGGYYSPEVMTLIGPFVRYRSALCRSYWFDIQASAGWLHQHLDDSPVYPDFDGDVSGFTPAAAADALAEYRGGSDDKPGISARIQGMKLVTDRLAVGGFAGIDNSADYTLWQVGAGLQFFFEPQQAFWQHRDFFREFGSCSNR